MPPPNPQFFLHTANDPELLLEQVLDLLERPVPGCGPFTPETLVVPSAATAQLMRDRLARERGFVMNLDLLYPRNAVFRLLQAFLPGLPLEDPFTPEALTWRLMGLLPDLSSDPDPEAREIARYCHRASPASRHKLAARLARVYDRYLLDRPDWILRWERPDEEPSGWQGRLWRRIVAETGDYPHLARCRKHLTRNPAPDEEALPSRLIVWASGYLPGYYLEMFNRLSLYREVHYLQPRPTGQYWGYLGGPGEPELETSAGRFLSLTGKTLRTAADQLEELGYHQGLESFREGESRSALQCLHNALLRLEPLERSVDRPLRAPLPAPTVRPGRDSSITFQEARHALEEVTLLRREILGLLVSDEPPRLDQMAIVVPSADRYSSALQAALMGGSSPALPFHFLPRNPVLAQPAVAAFFACVDFISGEATRDDLVALITSAACLDVFAVGPARKRAIELALDAFGYQRGWLRHSSGDEASHPGPASTEATCWEAFYARLLQGTFEGIGIPAWPFLERELSDALPGNELLDTFRRVHQLLTPLARMTREARTATGWAAILQRYLPRFAQGTDPGAIAPIQEGLTAVATAARDGGFDEAVEFPVVVHALRERIRTRPGTSPRLGAGSGIPVLLLGDSIPGGVRHLFLLGARRDWVVPSSAPSPLDRIESDPRHGDTSAADVAAGALLELVLAARESLWISAPVGSGNADGLFPVALESLRGTFGTTRTLPGSSDLQPAESGPAESAPSAAPAHSRRTWNDRSRTAVTVGDALKAIQYPTNHYCREALGAAFPGSLLSAANRYPGEGSADPLAGGLTRWHYRKLLMTLPRIEEGLLDEACQLLGARGRVPERDDYRWLLQCATEEVVLHRAVQPRLARSGSPMANPGEQLLVLPADEDSGVRATPALEEDRVVHAGRFKPEAVLREWLRYLLIAYADSPFLAECRIVQFLDAEIRFEASDLTAERFETVRWILRESKVRPVAFHFGVLAAWYQDSLASGDRTGSSGRVDPADSWREFQVELGRRAPDRISPADRLAFEEADVEECAAEFTRLAGILAEPLLQTANLGRD